MELMLYGVIGKHQPQQFLYLSKRIVALSLPKRMFILRQDRSNNKKILIYETAQINFIDVR